MPRAQLQNPLDLLRRQVAAARWLLDETRPGRAGRTPPTAKAPLEASILLMAAAWEGFVEATAIESVKRLRGAAGAGFVEPWMAARAIDEVESRQANNPNGQRTRYLLWRHFGYDMTPDLGLVVRRREWSDGAWFRDRHVSGVQVIEMMDGFYKVRNNLMHGSGVWSGAKGPPRGVLARGYKTTGGGRVASGRWSLQDWCAYNCVDVFEHAGETIAARLSGHLGFTAPV